MAGKPTKRRSVTLEFFAQNQVFDIIINDVHSFCLFVPNSGCIMGKIFFINFVMEQCLRAAKKIYPEQSI